MRRSVRFTSLCALLVLAGSANAQQSGQENQRYGFGLLDRRSSYGLYWFPEPLRAQEMDVDNELRLDWLHTEKQGHVADSVELEIEKSFGLLTMELEVPYERESSRAIDPLTSLSTRTRVEGIGNIELSARHPVFQWVSWDERIDWTLVGALEVAAPSGSSISKDWEVVPELFSLLRIGEHFSVQASVGYSTLIGPEESGKQTLEYAAVFGWGFEAEQLGPGLLQRLVPVVELLGETGLNQGDSSTVLTGTLGMRMNFDTLGAFQPRLGIGYVFPINQNARDELRWGIVTSLVFEF